MNGFTMIDWLTVHIPLVHNPIPQGRRLTVDADGQLLSSFVTRAVFEDKEGSYSKRIFISSEFSLDFDYNSEENGKANVLTISGNPAKFIQGHNCFGVECIRSLLVLTCDKIYKDIGLSRKQFKTLFFNIKTYNFTVSRVDITRSFVFPDNSTVDKFIRMLQFSADTRGNRCELTHNTFYIGKHSTVWSMKFYNKFREIKSKSRHHSLPTSLRDVGIYEYVENLLRVELVLRKKELDKNYLSNPRNLQLNLDEIFNSYASRIYIKNQLAEDIDTSSLSPQHLRTYLLWCEGHNLLNVLPKSTFYRHNSFFRTLGINLKQPRVKLSHHETTVSAIRDLTQSTLPNHLSNFQIRTIFND